MPHFALRLLVAIALVSKAAIASAATIDLDSVGLGWIAQNGASDGSANGNNYLLGSCACYGPGPEFRNFFNFEIPTSLSGSIVSATLVLSTVKADLSQSPTLEVTFTSTNAIAFAELGTGSVYAVHTYTSADSYSVQTIPLGPVALADISANLGEILTVSGRVSSPTDVSPSNLRNQFVYGDSGLYLPSGLPTQITRLVIETVPEPASFGLAGATLIALFAGKRFTSGP